VRQVHCEDPGCGFRVHVSDLAVSDLYDGALREFRVLRDESPAEAFRAKPEDVFSGFGGIDQRVDSFFDAVPDAGFLA
jgi:hypothetical protein